MSSAAPLSRDLIVKIRGGFHESVKISFKNFSTECSRIGGSSNVKEKLVCSIRISFAQLIQHLQESPGRNRLYETADQRPRGRRAYLECAMDRVRVTTPLNRLEDKTIQLIGIFNCLLDNNFGIGKFIRRYCRFETFTRYVPTSMGSFLKSLESDVGVVQK
jgi:hypothetical protein